MNEVIKLIDINKIYLIKKYIWKKEKKEIQALKNISFSIEKGEIFGILGPNGAGKSTIIKIMATLLKENSGEIKIFNREIDSNENEIRQKINLISGTERGLYWRLTGKENLDYFAELYGITGSKKKELINELLKKVELFGRENEKVETYSKGMKQRLQIARGLLNNPEILFLDEPTLGLDIIGAKKLRELVKKLSQEGKTIIFTTHYMNEAEEICDRVLFINKGEILNIGTINELQNKIFGKKKIKIKFKEKLKEDLNLLLKNLLTNGTEKNVFLDKEINFFYDEEIFDYKTLLLELPLKNIERFELSNASLEDLYLDIMEDKNE